MKSFELARKLSDEEAGLEKEKKYKPNPDSWPEDTQFVERSDGKIEIIPEGPVSGPAPKIVKNIGNVINFPVGGRQGSVDKFPHRRHKGKQGQKS